MTEDLVRYMHDAQFWANENFLTEDPEFAVDFAPNGRTTGFSYGIWLIDC